MTGGRDVALVGVGHSRIFRRDAEPLGLLAVEACKAAIADAGLEIKDIDGIAGNPDEPFDGAGPADGLHLVTPNFIRLALGLDNLRWRLHMPGIAVTVIDPFLQAVNAVASGACDNALVFRALHNPQGRYGQTDPAEIEGDGQYFGSYGLFPAAWSGLQWQGYMSKYGTRREEMAEFALNARRWGLMWEYGYWYQHRPEMLTRDAYLNARMISWPTSMLDCDIPVQGAGALVISAADRALDLRNRPAYIVGTAQGPRQVRPRVYVTPFEEAETNFAKVASDLWADSGLSPSDISVANLYDGFTIFTPLWLEALGFCEYGEAFSFASFDRTGVDGPFPLNTSGGSQGAGRMHGIPQLMDGALQVMGRSGQRQIEDVQFSLVTIGASHNAGAVIFSTEPRSA